MNDDRCVHVPTSPGQGVCTCLDTRMWLRFCLEVERATVDYLLERAGLTRADLPAPNLLNIPAPTRKETSPCSPPSASCTSTRQGKPLTTIP